MARTRSAHNPESRVSKIEYKTILLPYKPSIFQSDDTELTTALNKEAAEGWRLVQIALPSTIWGRANGMVAILERAKS
jgi:hypothetical protein